MKNKYILSLLLAITVLTFSYPVLAIIGPSTDNFTLVLPTSGQTTSGTLSINLSFNVPGYQLLNFTNISVFISSPSTANSSSILWSPLNNYLYNQTPWGFNHTFNTFQVEDANDYTITLIVRNDSDGPKSTNLTFTRTITVNNTIPGVATLTNPSDLSVDKDNSVTFTSDVNGSSTTACTLVFDGTNPGSATESMTHTGTTCNVTLTAIPETSYKWFVRTTDGNDIRESSVQTISVDTDTSTRRVTPAIQEAGKKTLGITDGEVKLTDGIIGLIIVMVVVVLFFVIKGRK